jgi:hypothetical protein
MSMAADDGRSQELGLAGFLLGAGMPDDQQDAHQGDEDGQKAQHFVSHHRAERVVVHAVAGTAHRPGGWVVHELGPRLPIRHGSGKGPENSLQ